MVLIAIVSCEIAFWVAILAGLATRYILRRPKLGGAFLIAAPVIDVALLAFVTADLLTGAAASWHHGLAAVYIGVSVAYGRRMIAWADVRFMHRYASGPGPVRLDGREYTKKCWGDALRTAVAAVITAMILGGLITLVDSPDRTEELQSFFAILGIVLAVELLWAVSYTLWPKKAVQHATAR